MAVQLEQDLLAVSIAEQDECNSTITQCGKGQPASPPTVQVSRLLWNIFCLRKCILSVVLRVCRAVEVEIGILAWLRPGSGICADEQPCSFRRAGGWLLVPTTSSSPRYDVEGCIARPVLLSRMVAGHDMDDGALGPGSGATRSTWCNTGICGDTVSPERTLQHEKLHTWPRSMMPWHPTVFFQVYIYYHYIF